jgi:hypothetical protein
MQPCANSSGQGASKAAMKQSPKAKRIFLDSQDGCSFLKKKNQKTFACLGPPVEGVSGQ